jgi:DNA-binding NtrC family response regulator
VKARLRMRILLVDDETIATRAFDLILREAGFEVLRAKSFAESITIMKDARVDLVITDLRLSDASGMDLITHIKSKTPDTEVILMTAYGSVDITIEAIKRGAFYYLEKPFTPERLFALVERALQFATLRRRKRNAQTHISRGG